MKKLGMLGIIGGAALLAAAPFSLQWSQENVALSINGAEARIAGGVHRRVYRSSPYYPSYYAPQPYSSYYRPVSVRTVYYPYPPPRYSYYLPPFASVSSYDPRMR